MKYSQFNTIIPINSHLKAVYNALWHRLVLINYDINLNHIDTLPSSIHESLIQGGMLIEDNVNELDDVESLRNQAVLDSNDSFLLILNPTLRCNFDCWYCYESHLSSSDMNDNTYLHTCRCIDFLTHTKRELSISFFGGEPLLGYKKIVAPIMEYAIQKGKENNCIVNFSFTTNGYLLTDDIVDDLKQYDINHLQITLDGDKKSHDKTRIPKNSVSYDRIINNIKNLANNHIHVTMRLNISSKTIKSAFNIPDDFKNIPRQTKKMIKVSIHQIWQDKKNNTNIKAEIYNLYEHFAKNEFDIDIPKPHQLKDPCYADRKNSCVINSDGRLFKCTAVDFANTEATGILSSSGELIFDDSSLERVHEIRKNSTRCSKCRIMPLCNGGCYKNIWFQNNRSEIKCLHPTDKDKDIEVVKVVEDLLFFEMLSKTYNINLN